LPKAALFGSNSLAARLGDIARTFDIIESRGVMFCIILASITWLLFLQDMVTELMELMLAMMSMEIYAGC